MRLNARKSPIWKSPKDEILSIVKSSNSIAEILRHFGLRNIGGNYLTLKKRLQEDGIDYSHIKLGLKSNRGRKFPAYTLSREQCIEKWFVLQTDPFAKKGNLKYFVRKHNLIPYVCKCGNEGEWCGHPLSLQLDHVDGNSLNHVLSNLRWLCPNCHSQTVTFAGRNLKKQL